MSKTPEPQLWQTMPTEILLERAWVFADRQAEYEAGRCIHALAWRLRGSEEWIESLKRRTPKTGLDETLRDCGRRLAELTRQERSSAQAALFFYALLEVLHQAGLTPPSLLDEIREEFAHHDRQS